MIHPNLATMLAVVTTDYPLEPGEAHEFLRPAVDESFNAISVDGECSTNDTVVLLANGASGVGGRRATTRRSREALARVCADLARPDRRRRRRRDRSRARSASPAPRRRRGEGDRAADRDLAARQDRAVRARRELGPRARRRRLGAVQRRLRAARPGARDARFDGARVLERGAPAASSRRSTGATCTIDLDLGLGDGCASYLTSDLSSDYVRINADYRS